MAARMTPIRCTALLVTLALAACGGSGSPQAAQGPQLVVHDRAAPEGAPNDTPRADFAVALSQPLSRDVQLAWRTEAGTAEAGSDFEAAEGVLTIPAGRTEGLVSVALIGDDLEEDDEHFRLLLSSEEVALHRNHAIGTIANDDSACLPALPGTENPWLARRPISFAHRGGVIEFPENTLFAYHRADAVGADVLEMDVYQTSDGALVVLHDLTVDRTTDGSGNVGDFTLAELKALDAAYWFVPGTGTTRDAPESAYVYRGIATGDRPPPAGFTANDFRIPTLEEALARFPHALLNIELKPDLDGTGRYEGQMARLLKAYGRDDDVMVASFDDSASALFELQNGCASTAVPLVQAAVVVLASKGPLPMLPPPGHQAFQVPIDTSSVSQIPDPLQIEVVTDDFIADAHNAGLAVHVWTIDDCPTMVDLLHRGVDGIMTDRPLRLAQVLAQPEGEWNCESVD